MMFILMNVFFFFFLGFPGSQDAGERVLASDHEVNSLIEELGRNLNLKRHISGAVEQKEVSPFPLTLSHRLDH